MNDSFEQMFAECRLLALENATANICKDIAGSKDNRPLVIYGAGGNCDFACYFLSLYGIKSACVCDSVKTGTYDYRGIRQYDIISPDVLLNDYSDARVLISPWKYEEEIKTGLIELGFPESSIYYLRSDERMSSDEFESKHLNVYRNGTRSVSF
ncbi:hypothetical protein FACS1894167_15850 [Synergistales bacterium]|nr:hypothetical protein FACS1894167_15850 [Synergistales bacterium]